MNWDGLYGSVHPNNKGDKYYVMIRVPTEDGSMSDSPKRFGPFQEQEQAKNKLIKLNNEFNTGEYQNFKNYSMDEYLSWWIEEYVDVESEDTYEQYYLNLKNHVIPAMGDKKVNEVTSFDIERLYKSLREDDYSEWTVYDIHKVIRKALNDAIESVPEDVLEENPARKVTNKPDPNSRDFEIFSPEEKEKFLRIAKRKGFDTYFPIFHVAFETGLRRGELAGLFWKNLDLEEGKLTVDQQLKSSKQISSPKSRNGYRTIGIPNYIVEMLKEYKEKHEKKKSKLMGDFKAPEAVFTSATHDLIWPNKINEKFREIKEEAGIKKDLTVSSIRDTHATELLQAGHNPIAVANRLGHGDTEVLLDHYGTYTNSDDDHIVKSLEEKRQKK